MNPKKHIRVMIAEDDPQVRDLLSEMLTQRGYEIAGLAFDGIEAVRLAETLKPDVAIMDLKMPGKSGLEAIREIQKTRKMPFVVLTSHSDPRLFDQVADSGIGAYLVKPAKIDEIERAISISIARFDDMLKLSRLNEKLEAEVAERKRIAVELKNSRQRLKHITDASLEGIVFIRNGVIRESNDIFPRMFGYEFQHVIQSKLLDLIPEPFKNDVRRKMASVENSQIETQGLKKDGTYFPIVIYFRETVIEGETFQIAIIRDITERKKAELKILRAKEEWERTFDAVPDLIAIIDSDFRIVRVNKAMAERLNMFPEKCIGRKCYEIVHQMDTHPDICPHHRTLVDGKVHSVEIYEQNLEGEFLVTTSPLLDTEGNMAGTVHVARDITELKQIERSLKEALSRLRVIIDTIPGMIHVVDREYSIQTASKSFYLFHNIPIDQDLTGKKCHEIRKKRMTVCSECVAGKVFKTGRLQTRISTTEEDAVTGSAFKMYAAPIKNDQGEVINVVEIMVDITDLKEMEKALEKAKKDAEHANQTKSEFLANMSHEIRTPMNAIVGMTQVLRDTKLNKKQQEYLRTIYASSKVLLALINDILDFSKIEAGKIELDSVAFDLQELIKEVVDILSMEAASKNLELTYDIRPNVFSRLIGDPVRLRQILMNLVNNGIKFTERGGVSVLVDAADQTETQITVRMTVTDTGIGIPKDRMDRLFLSFSQIDASTTRKYGGTGLGLAISRQLVEMMGGEITVDSRVDQGSSFQFTVVLKKQQKQQQFKKSAPRIGIKLPFSLSGKSVRVLVVEDNLPNQKVAQAILEKLGYRVGIAGNGAKAIEILKKEPFDIVLMDVQMPEMDGLEVTRIIRNPNSGVLNPNIPVIAMTARTTTADYDRCLRAGMNDYLTKPIDPEKLSKSIEGIRYGKQAVEDLPHKNPVKEMETIQMIIDKDDLMMRVGNDISLIKQVLGISLDEIPKKIKSAKDAIASRDAEQLKFSAHSIKGMAGNIAAKRLHILASQIEELGLKGDIETADSKLSDLEKTFDELKAFIYNKNMID